MAAELSPKLKKSLTYTLFILLVLSVFLLGYFFYFLPKNKQTIDNNGFLILKTIIANIEAKADGRGNLYSNFYNNVFNKTFSRDIIITPKDSVGRLLEENDIKAKYEYLPTKAATGNEPFIIDPINKEDTIIYRLSLENTDFVFSINKTGKRDSLVFFEEVSDFLLPILSTQKDELFQFYALSRISGKESKLLFHDPDLGIRTDAPLDTLLPKNLQAYFTGERDITSQGFNHKMFYYPFELNGVQMVLSGFAPTNRYNAEIRKVPFGFVYPLAIAFLLLLFFLPILKFYIMDSNEQVRIIDVALFGLSVFMGVSLLTLVVIQYFLWEGEEERVKINLIKLSDKIGQNFLKELNNVYTALENVDSVRLTDALQLSKRISSEKLVDYSDSIHSYIRKRYLDPSKKNSTGYYYFDRVSWINKDGFQVIKAEMHGKPVFTNVKDRNYFKVLQNNHSMLLTYKDSIREFGWEPIYSWTNGDFNISISKKTKGYIEAMAAKMYSVVNALLPVGYGFCIIDQEGKVQVHSDMKRNLRENFFDKAETSGNIRGFAAARQEITINDVMMYGKWHIMHITPIKNLPYFLITFYDRGSIFPINLRILIFALLFCLLFAVICIVLWLALARVGFKSYPLVYCPMDCLTWLTPQKKETDYYFHASVFLAVYAILFVASSALYNSDNISNYTVFSMILLTPFNVVFVLFSIRAFSKDQAERTTKVETEHETVKSKYSKTFLRAAKITCVHMLITLVYYIVSRLHHYSIDFLFLGFQFLFISWIWWYRLLVKKVKDNNLLPVTNERDKTIESKYDKYLHNYTVMLTLLIICLSVLPGALFTWYAHNQEDIQVVKKQQLHMLNDIQQRSNEIMRRNGIKDTLIPAEYLKELLYYKGIYTINREDSVTFDFDTTFINKNSPYSKTKGNDENTRETYDNFYFTIADAISSPYYDPGLYPALRDYAADSNWSWQIKDNKLHFRSYKSFISPLKENQRLGSVHMVFEMPVHFKFLKIQRLSFLLLSIVMLIALYTWLKININNIFLLKFIRKAVIYDNKKQLFIKEFYNSPNLKFEDKEQLYSSASYTNFKNDNSLSTKIKDNERVYSSVDYASYTTSIDPEKLKEYEIEILGIVKEGKDLFNFIWQKCSEKERYLLFDFANDGLINYKNTKEIYNLISNGIFVMDDNYRMRLFSPGFRAYLLDKSDDADIISLQRKYHQNSSWQAVKGPFLLLMFGFAAVVFFTQEATFQKFIALAGGIGTVISLIPKFFAAGSSKSKEDKS